MSTFKIGEVAFLVGIEGPDAHLNGLEVTVTSGLYRTTGLERITGKVITAMVYDIAGAEPINRVTPDHLRKRPEKGDETSWETVEAISGWKPSTVEVPNGEDQRVEVPSVDHCQLGQL